MALHPTRPAERAAEYRAPGGPWHGLPPLDRLLDPAAFVDGSTGERLSADELDARVAALAGGLASRGVRAGDVVTWQLPNGASAVALFRACWRLGAIATPVHHKAGPAEAASALDQVEPAVRVGGDDDVLALRAEGGVAPVEGGSVDVDPTTIAVVMFTSGSTGRPKAVLHTHETLGFKAQAMARVHGLTSRDVVLMPAPMAHVSGLLNGVLVAAVAGMTTVTMAAWDPAHALELIEKEHVSFMAGAPTFFLAMRDDPSFTPNRVASLRLLSCGGSGITPTFVESTAARFDCVVKRTYGSTEAPTVTTSYEGDPPERAATTDGRATGPVELRTVDGELWVRGPELCVGYAHPDDNRRFTDDGWLRTGDLATLTDGWLTITGRTGDLIIRGGENITAGEVEAALEAHPEVRAAVAVGYPDDRLGERVCAFVVVSGDPESFGLDEVREWCAARGVTRFKWPERVQVLGELPMLASGKADRARLRALAASGALDADAGR